MAKMHMTDMTKNSRVSFPAFNGFPPSLADSAKQTAVI